MTATLQDLVTTIQYYLNLLIVIGLTSFGLVGLAYLTFILWKHRGREEKSLDFVLLQVALPRDNEIKIDTAEQMLANLRP